MPANNLRGFINQPLEWRQPSIFKRAYELRVGDILLATLAKQGTFKSAYDVWTPEGQWTIRREGFWRTELVVLDAQGSEIARAVYRMSGKADLRTSAGYAYQWKSTNFWSTHWAWCSSENMPLVVFQKGHVTILPEAQDLPDLTLLVVLTRYLKIFKDESDASAAAVTVTT